ncbi:cytochrome c biogenesis protein/redoxin [Atopobium fossor]|uniref:cytochrome c biogenesis protein/redoxin n=1 Tax=Atopobium fossor TaxID=39487 RepID=UPI00040641F2|nr:cytochrome c biogenesis protein/redoxin [Atopobium fossor]
MADIGMFASTFFAGALSFFSPCILPVLPVYIGLLLTEDGTVALVIQRRIANTLAFIAGISITFFALGFGAGFFGGVLSNPLLSVGLGFVICLFGLHLAGILVIPALDTEKRVDMQHIDAKHVGGAFLLGLAFSFGWTPCIGPVLATVLALAAQQGNALQGGLLLVVYSLGLSVPFAVLALGSSVLLEKVRQLNKYTELLKKIGGVCIALLGAWMVISQVGGLGMPMKSMDTQTQDSHSKMQQGDGMNDSEVAQSMTEWKQTSLKTLDGKTLTLESLKGKPVYVKMWATWCPACLNGLDEFTRVAAEHEKKGDIEVVSVLSPGLGSELSEDQIINWVTKQKITAPILMDNTGTLLKDFDIQAYPTSVFINSNGTIVDKRIGDVPTAELEKILSSLT